MLTSLASILPSPTSATLQAPLSVSRILGLCRERGGPRQLPAQSAAAGMTGTTHGPAASCKGWGQLGDGKAACQMHECISCIE